MREIGLAMLVVGPCIATQYRYWDWTDSQGMAVAVGIVIVGTILVLATPSKRTKRRRKLQKHYEASSDPTSFAVGDGNEPFFEQPAAARLEQPANSVAAYKRDIKAAAWAITVEGSNVTEQAAAIAKQYTLEPVDVATDIERLLGR